VVGHPTTHDSGGEEETQEAVDIPSLWVFRNHQVVVLDSAFLNTLVSMQRAFLSAK